jgi:hypothetical protein
MMTSRSPQLKAKILALFVLQATRKICSKESADAISSLGVEGSTHED